MKTKLTLRAAKTLAITGLVSLLCGCSSHNGPLALFKKLSPHDQYAQHLSDAGLAGTALGQGWVQLSQQVLASPLTITPPYRETGYFPADKIKASALRFAAKRGQKISVQLSRKPPGPVIYADLLLDGQVVASADSNTIAFEVKQAGNYVLRLQPELLKRGEYILDVTLGPALHFPVSASGHPKIEGFWGDGRDNNSRKHEGIDIFVPKGTPALAADNGTVVNVGENKLGGLVVLMQPEGRDYTLYYAHLGVQLVHTGQQVKAGDTLGLIDNTGNAKTTPSHLHFGIYINGGAIDPLLFVKPENDVSPTVTAPLTNLNAVLRFNQVPVTILAATKNLYKVSYPDNETAFVPVRSVKPLSDNMETMPDARAIYDRPDTGAASMAQIAAGGQVTVKGIYKNFELVEYKDLTGWIFYDKK